LYTCSKAHYIMASISQSLTFLIDQDSTSNLAKPLRSCYY